MLMYNLPVALLRSNHALNPPGSRGDIIPSLNLGLALLHLHNLGKLRVTYFATLLKPVSSPSL
jgi:hypothetical protein